MFIESDFTDCCDEISNAKLKDGFFEEDETDWIKKEKDDYAFCVGEREQMSLSDKTVKILAGIRNAV